ncbi:hypothetical protein [Streptomyces sp. JHA19]|uniref:hypothetical protein n=1 Tax=Streptomyces sp. JHA19 TaxID=1577588 RepID=UPI0006E355F0|nr:hypothetical protein [Streptomyces sp. JHA19]
MSRTSGVVTLLAALLLTAACTSGSEDPNAPLPRKAKDDALRWARESTASMAELTDVKLLPDTEKVHFEDCLGKNDEVAEDGRYSLFYYIYSPAPATDHTRIVRRLRSDLTERDYEVTAYREFKNAYESAMLWARNKKNNYAVEADTVGLGEDEPQRFSFAVRTPCLLPPGVKQRQF